MSIGLVLRHTYQETCEICETVSKYTKKAMKSFYAFCESVGYARAASYLAAQGYHEEAKALMMERNKYK